MVQYLYHSLYFTCLLAFVLGSSLEDLQQKYADFAIECMEDYPLTSDDLEQLKNKKLPDKESVKCLFACAYKKAGMIDEEGKMSVKGTHEIINKYLADDPDKMKKAIAFTDACESVNDEAVDDGAKGCDRAALMVLCTIKKAPEFGVSI